MLALLGLTDKNPVLHQALPKAASDRQQPFEGWKSVVVIVPVGASRPFNVPTAHVGSLYVCMTMPHAGVGVLLESSKLKSYAIEENETALFKQGSPKLSSVFHRDRQEGVRHFRQLAVRFVGQKGKLCTFRFCNGSKPDADGCLARTADKHETIAMSHGRSCYLAQKMHFVAKMHEPHCSHLSDQPRAPLSRKEPAPLFVTKYSQ